MLRRLFTAWRGHTGGKVLKALGHWEASHSGLGPAFRWWRRTVQHLREANVQAQQHRQKHACRAAFQVMLRLTTVWQELWNPVCCMRRSPAESGVTVILGSA